jgi:hypothetical protein
LIRCVFIGLQRFMWVNPLIFEKIDVIHLFIIP